MTRRRRRTLEALAVSTVLGLGASAAQGQLGFGLRAPGADVLSERLVEVRAQVDRARARRADIDQRLGNIEPKRRALRASLAQHGRSLYRVSRGGMLPLAGGLEALLGHASRVERLRRLVTNEMDDLRALDREGVALRKEALDLDASMETRERDVRALEQARVGLAQQQAAQQMFESAFATPGPSPSMGSRINYGLSIIGGSSAASFADQRGSLALPVSGPNRIADASRAESDGPGLELAAHSGAAVRAAASGRVAFADRYGSYGQLVILEHGDRYYTVYGGLSHIEVSVGDDLSKSARLGVAGVDPVYFEVRRGTRTQDARTWLGL